MMLNEISRSIFRAYDIRGIVDDTLTESTVFAIGRALGSLVLEKGEKTICVGRDGRLSGPALVSALNNGILSTGCNVIYLGMVPTPLLYYSTYVLNANSGVMLTGSHNPSNYNGLKMMIKGETLAEDGIQALYQRIMDDHFQTGTGLLSSVDIKEAYYNRITQDITLNRPLKIVIDCGNGVAGDVAPTLYRRLGCEVIELYCEVDGRFPHHHPDPSQTENLQALIQTVKHHQADIGLAFDGDGDRLGVITNQGEVIWADRQLMLFAQSVLKKNPGATIIYDVKCSSHLEVLIKNLGGEPIMWKTGHSLIKSKLKETKAALAGEMSGHLFFNDRWYGFDDALYSGARLLEILASEETECSTLFRAIPDSVNTPELKIMVDEDEKFFLMEELIRHANFEACDKVTIDGLRVNFADGWGLVRPSNTTPCLVLRFEAQSEKVLQTIQHLFRDLLLTVKPDLVLPF